MVTYLDESRLAGLLDYGRLISTVKRILVSDAIAPLRASLTRNGIWLGAMPAAGLGLQTVKIVGLYPGNPDRGLPYVRGVVLAFKEETGDLLFAADAAPITGYRTAAASCLALELMGYKGEEPVGVIGAGAQGYHHARCLAEIYGVRELIVYDRERRRAEAFTSNLSLHARVKVAGSLEDVHKSRLIVAATTSQEPVVKGSLLSDGAYIISLGAPKPVWELDEKVLEDAGCLLVDTIEGFNNESGEASWKPKETHVVELKEVLSGRKCEWKRLKAYKSVGTALFDLAAALAVYEAMESSE